MPEIKVYVSEEEKEVIKTYAEVDERSTSEMMRKAMREKVSRDKKRCSEGQLIVWPR